MKDAFTLLEDTLEHGATGEQVPGVTVVVDGKFRQVLDAVIARSGRYETYSQVLGDAITRGITDIIETLR